MDVARTLPMIWAPLLASLRISIRVESEGDVKIAERREAEAEGSDAWEMTAGQRKSPRSVSKEDGVAKRSGEEGGRLTAQNSQAGQLVRAQMGNMGSEPVREQPVPSG